LIEFYYFPLGMQNHLRILNPLRLPIPPPGLCRFGKQGILCDAPGAAKPIPEFAATMRAP